MKILKMCAIALTLTLAITGCAAITNASSASSVSSDSGSKTITISDTSVEELSVTDKDNDTSYDESEAEIIDLSKVSGTTKITSEGTYIVTGSTSDGSVIIEVTEEEDVHLILRDASVTSATSAAIYVISADEVYITLEGSNTLANGGSFTASGEDDIDAVIYSKDDLTINGDGSVKITSPAGHGIVCKDDLVITGGTFDIDASEDGINTNDSIAITAGSLTVKAGDDAIHTDGILQIDGGTFDITAGEGLEGTYIVINDGSITISASDDGINAAQKSDAYTPTIEINGGNIKITMGQGDTDGLDSNGNIIINGGVVDITGQSTCDYDGKAEFNGGTLIVNGSEVDSIPNQFMGGGQGGQGGMGFPGGQDGQSGQGGPGGGRGMRPDFQNTQT
ncbi:protein of unknown function [Ruminococcaceae bacterium YRB3002]|nr:protein of unknown function [Ruminococcaceae bacterium YRB3002]